MPTRSPRTLLILVVGTVLVLNSCAATGVALLDPADERQTHVDRCTDTIELPSNAFSHASSSSTSLLTASSTVTSIVLLAGYDRSDDSELLEHDVRKEIHDEIHQSSGTYGSDLQEAYDIPRSTLRYHLGVLEREELIASETIFGKLWYYPTGSDADELRAALTNDAIGEVVDAIARLEPVCVTDLASEVERSPSTVSYHLDRLEDAGLVEQERRSAAVLSRLAPEARTELRTPVDPEDST